MKNFLGILCRCLIYFILAAAIIVTIFPLALTVSNSFKTNMEIMSMPGKILPVNASFDNYKEAWNSEAFNVARMLFNSIWFTVLDVFVIVLNSTMMGYAFERGEFRGKKIIFAVFSALMFISFGGVTIYPTFDILNHFGLSKSLWGLIVLHAFSIPIMNAYIVRGFVRGLPKELDESARIEGCSFLKTFFRIILPLLKPSVATIIMLTFNSSWNSYLMPAMFTLTRPDQQTLIVGIMALKNSGAGATSWNIMFAGTIITLFPVFLMFIFGNKYITKGITAGAVKG